VLRQEWYGRERCCRAWLRAGDVARCLRSESPSATEDLKAKQWTLGASGNDRQDDDHAPGNSQKEGLSWSRHGAEQTKHKDWPKIMVLLDWTALL
jgi:hypothetical protein